MRWTGRGGGQECRCGHDRFSHEHYRQGTDCSAPNCDCPRFRRRWIAVDLPGNGEEPPRGAEQDVASNDAGSRDPVRAGLI